MQGGGGVENPRRARPRLTRSSAANAADKRAAGATYAVATGGFTVPARTAVVFVVN
ncbi:MAG: hypothetical protein U5L05_18580 [Rubrivivax sp.]|nr:hypothetical protein [Rubrivivax sp.]